MPRQRSTKAAQAIVDDAQAMLSLDLVEDLAEPLARYMLENAAGEEWHDSPQVNALSRVAALFAARGREVPSVITDAIEKAAEADHPIASR